MEDISSIKIKKIARISGLLYLIVIGACMFAELSVRQALFVTNDSLATAKAIQANEMLYRFGFVADLINLICGLPVILFFWLLFKKSHYY